MLSTEDHRNLATRLRNALREVEAVRQEWEDAHVPDYPPAGIVTALTEAALGIRHSQLRLDKELVKAFPDRTFSYWSEGGQS